MKTMLCGRYLDSAASLRLALLSGFFDTFATNTT
jgi:hypothetical protein